MNEVIVLKSEVYDLIVEKEKRINEINTIDKMIRERTAKIEELMLSPKEVPVAEPAE